MYRKVCATELFKAQPCKNIPLRLYVHWRHPTGNSPTVVETSRSQWSKQTLYVRCCSGCFANHFAGWTLVAEARNCSFHTELRQLLRSFLEEHVEYHGIVYSNMCIRDRCEVCFSKVYKTVMNMYEFGTNIPRPKNIVLINLS